jgi:Family of unknown function (DUF6958)
MSTSTRATSRARSRPSTEDRVMVENIIRPQSRRRVDGPKYRAMRRALLAVVPRRAPGLTLADALAAVIPRLPTVLFPGGAGAGWWFKTVQLDLEAKRLLVRERTSPIKVHQSREKKRDRLE